MVDKKCERFGLQFNYNIRVVRDIRVILYHFPGCVVGKDIVSPSKGNNGTAKTPYHVAIEMSSD